ncbi:hypothetical protein DFJ77DRAFT_515693 [Powellomyces hirtus]|nr:hypothetical protein DFJ77DRAFT_515693 [Powellomyces hirtus]
MIALSAELVDQIVDHLWDDLVTHLDTKQYLCLALVCKAFKNVMYAKHRRKTLMLAQSASSVYYRGSNPFIPPLELLASIFDRIELDTFATYMLPLLLKHKSRIDSFLCTTERPYLWKTKGAAYVYGASLGREIRLFMRYRTCWLLKGVGTLERTKRSFGIHGVFLEIVTPGPAAHDVSNEHDPVVVVNVVIVGANPTLTTTAPDITMFFTKAATLVAAAAVCAFSRLSLAAPAPLPAAAAVQDGYVNDQLVRLQVPEGAQLLQLHKFLEDNLNLDIWDTQADHIDFRVPAARADEILKKDPLAKANVKLSGAGAAADVAVAAAADWFTEYHRFADIVAWYKALATANPTLVTFVPSIGKTVQGRDIFAVKITSPTNAGQEAYVSDQLVKSYATSKTLLDTTEFIIVPVVNPDGYEYTWTGQRLWRKNRASPSGVDLNRNYNDHWGQGGSSSNPGSETYRGPSAASEPETRAVQSYFMSFPRLVGAIDFHAYSQLVLRPLGYSTAPAKDEALNKQAGDGISAAIRRASGLSYVSQPSIDLYQTTGSSTDYWYTQRRIYSFCIELRPNSASGNGFILPPAQIIPTGKEIWESLKWWVDFTSKNPLPKR